MGIGHPFRGGHIIKYADAIDPSMEDSLGLCASAFVRNKGKSVFSENDFLMGMSMDYHWMSYSDSKLFLSAMISEGLFERSGGYIRASPEVSEGDVPVAYRPSGDLIERVRSLKGVPVSKPVAEGPESVPKEEVPAEKKADDPEGAPRDMMPILMNLAVEMGMERRDFIMSSNSIQRNLNIAIEVAALFVLRDAGMDVADLADEVYESMKLR